MALEGDSHLLNHETYTYLMDSGATIAISSMNPLAHNNVRCLRVMAFPKSYSVRTGTLGHVYVNSCAPVRTDVINLPGIVEFTDPAVPAMLGLWAKEADTSNVYLDCLPLPLHQGKDAKGMNQWVGDTEVKAMRLQIVKKVSLIADADGQARLKEWKEWLKAQPLAHFRNLNISTPEQLSVFTKAGQFGKNIVRVLDICELKLRKQSKQISGQEHTSKGRKGKSKELTTDTELALVNSMLGGLSQLKTFMKKSVVPYLSVPIEHRVIELAIAPDMEDDEKLMEELEQCASPIRAFTSNTYVLPKLSQDQHTFQRRVGR